MCVYLLTQNLSAWEQARTELEQVPDEAWEGIPDASLQLKDRQPPWQKTDGSAPDTVE